MPTWEPRQFSLSSPCTVLQLRIGVGMAEPMGQIIGIIGCVSVKASTWTVTKGGRPNVESATIFPRGGVLLKTVGISPWTWLGLTRSADTTAYSRRGLR